MFPWGTRKRCEIDQVLIERKQVVPDFRRPRQHSVRGRSALHDFRRTRRSGAQNARCYRGQDLSRISRGSAKGHLVFGGPPAVDGIFPGVHFICIDIFLYSDR